MQHVDLPCPYIGVDVVPAIIGRNAAEFGDSSHRFEVLDACETALPEADVILCREVLFHLSFRDLRAALRNIKATGARYLIATTNPELAVNSDIPTGEFSERNLSISPANLGIPEHMISDGAIVESRALGVWRL